MSILLRGLFVSTAVSLIATSAAQATETITYAYDAKGRLVTVKRTVNSNPVVQTTYTHDKADNRKNTTTTGSPNSSPPP